MSEETSAGLSTIEEILDVVELPEDTVSLCLRGSLVGRFEELEARLRTATGTALSLGQPSEATQIAREMEDLRAEMARYTRAFHLRALPQPAWKKFYDRLPEEGKNAEEKESYDGRFHAWVCELVARCCYDPVMTAEQAEALCERLSGNQWKELSDAAWRLNAERVDIPFSAAASALTLAAGQSSRRPEHGESARPAGTGGSRGRSRRTSTTPKAG